jgi:Protein of unknown function (DUF2490)
MSSERVSIAGLRCAVLYFLFVCGKISVLSAQETGSQVLPEIDLYLKLNSQVRIQLTSSFTGSFPGDEWTSNPTIFIETALKPVLRRRLRQEPDVFRRRFLTFRAGYRYVRSLGTDPPTHENRAIVESLARYPLPWHFLISDRNRGEFRFKQGQPFSSRYRNRLRLEYDFQKGRLEFTPYADCEVFYDTRFDRWTPRRYESGVQFPISSHVMVEPYYLRQDSSYSTPRHISALGFKLNLYF